MLKFENSQTENFKLVKVQKCKKKCENPKV